MSLFFVLARLPLLSHTTKTTPLLILLIADETCGFEGDEGTYDRGICLDRYLQWISTLADNFILDKAINMRSISVCPPFSSIYPSPSVTSCWLHSGFQLSTFITLLYITFTGPPSELYAVEVLLLHHLHAWCRKFHRRQAGATPPHSPVTAPVESEDSSDSLSARP